MQQHQEVTEKVIPKIAEKWENTTTKEMVVVQKVCKLQLHTHPELNDTHCVIYSIIDSKNAQEQGDYVMPVSCFFEKMTRVCMSSTIDTNKKEINFIEKSAEILKPEQPNAVEIKLDRTNKTQQEQNQEEWIEV